LIQRLGAVFLTGRRRQSLKEKRGNDRVQDLINEYKKIDDEKLKDKEKELMTI